jgi:hypothetical protein
MLVSAAAEGQVPLPVTKQNCKKILSNRSLLLGTRTTVLGRRQRSLTDHAPRQYSSQQRDPPRPLQHDLQRHRSRNTAQYRAPLQLRSSCVAHVSSAVVRVSWSEYRVRSSRWWKAYVFDRLRLYDRHGGLYRAETNQIELRLRGASVDAAAGRARRRVARAAR